MSIDPPRDRRVKILIVPVFLQRRQARFASLAQDAGRDEHFRRRHRGGPCVAHVGRGICLWNLAGTATLYVSGFFGYAVAQGGFGGAAFAAGNAFLEIDGYAL